MKKVTYCFIVIVIILLVNTNNTFTLESNKDLYKNSERDSLNLIDNKIKKSAIEKHINLSFIFNTLISIGYHNDEAIYLINNDPTLNNQISDKMALATCFPSNPKNGTRCQKRWKISNSALGLPANSAGLLSLSQSEVAKRIVSVIGSSYVGVSVIAAGYLISEWNANNGFKGFNINAEYYYGPDNHLSYSWTVGPVSVNRYK